jgi:hypothetical protein
MEVLLSPSLRQHAAAIVPGHLRAAEHGSARFIQQHSRVPSDS